MQIYNNSVSKLYTKLLNYGFQGGQTLIETLVAIFILIMGVTAAAGLAVYALSTSTNITKQIVATGLAREGIEAVKNMRDTNWLKDSLDLDECYNFVTAQANDEDCFKQWLQPAGSAGSAQMANSFGFDLAFVGSTGLLDIDPDPNNRFWRLNNTDCDINDNDCGWGLDFSADPAADGVGGFYYNQDFNNGEKHGNSEYYRKITFGINETAPYTDDLERLEVVSQVWWTDKKCPRARDWSETLPTCRVELRTFLTNWKNY